MTDRIEPDGVAVIGAFVVRASGTTLDAETLLSYAAERLAAYKTPRQVVFVEALPRSPDGKIKHASLQEISGCT